MSPIRFGALLILCAMFIALGIYLFEVAPLFTPVCALGAGVIGGYLLRRWWEDVKAEQAEYDAEEDDQPAREESMKRHPSWQGQVPGPRVPPEDDPNWTRYTHGHMEDDDG